MLKCNHCGNKGEKARFSIKAWIPTQVIMDGNGEIVGWGEEQYDKVAVASDPDKHTIVCMACDSNDVVKIEDKEEE